MIECTDNYIWYKKRKKSSFKRFFCFILVFIILILNIFYYRNVICEQIFNICNDYAYASSTEAVNNAVLMSLDNNLEYSDLIKIEKNSNGDIVLMSTNAFKVNNLSKKISSMSLSILNQKLSNGIPIPLLAFSGIKLLSGYGKKINIKTANNVSVECVFSSKFSSAGINQTLHSIYIDVITKIVIEVPLRSFDSISKIQVLVSESVLVGKVPDIYLKDGVFK